MTLPLLFSDIDRPPFQVTETGWGEFDIQIRIMFVPESGEKPLTTYHRLKLHPWHPVTVRAPEASTNITEAPIEAAPVEGTPIAQYETDGDGSMQNDNIKEAEHPNPISLAQPPMEHPDAGGSSIKHPPVVHSWSYDEVVFPEPTEAFYEILLASPPTSYVDMVDITMN